VDGFSTWDNNAQFVQHIRIEGNRMADFYHQGFIAAAAYYSNSFDIVICNNEFRAATSWGVDAFNGIRDVKVYNNLFLDVTGYPVGINQGASGEVKNNIFYNSPGWDSATPASIGTKNIWYTPGRSLGGRFSGDIVNVDPLFVNVGNSDFHLRAGSPAIDTGVSLTAVPVDMDGKARPQGAGWDIGPYEFGASAPDTNAPVISGVTASSIAANSALVNWSTDEGANSRVEYGLTTAYASTVTNGNLVQQHQLSLSGLSASSVYHYRVRSSDQAGNMATSGDFTFQTTVAGSCVAPPGGLLGWWPGEGNANDIAGTNNGALQGSASAGTAGVVGAAFSFNGTSSYVQIPDSPSLHPTNFTIETWVRFDALDSSGSGGSPAGDQYLVFKQNTRASEFEGFDLRKTRVSGGDVFTLLVSSAASQAAQATSSTWIFPGVWYHVAAVRGSNFLQLYVNGQLEGQASVSFPQDYGNLPLYFGTSGQSYWDHKLAGSLDEVSLYDRALSPSEIAAVYTAGATGKCKESAEQNWLTSPLKQGTNFTFSFLGQTGRTYSIEMSTGLLNWSSVTNVTLTNGTAQISRPMSGPRQFYRAKLLP
jgi:hypothetical protein